MIYNFKLKLNENLKILITNVNIVILVIYPILFLISHQTKVRYFKNNNYIKTISLLHFFGQIKCYIIKVDKLVLLKY